MYRHVGCLCHSQVCPSGQISTTSTMTMTSTPTHLPQLSVGAGPPGLDGTKVFEVGAVRDPGQLYPPGRDSVPVVTEIVLVDTVLTETVSLVTIEKDPEGVRLDGSAVPGSDDVWVDKPLELAGGGGTPDDAEFVAAVESRVLPDGLVESGGEGLLGGGAP